jgi:hypothetical protein
MRYSPERFVRRRVRSGLIALLVAACAPPAGAPSGAPAGAGNRSGSPRSLIERALIATRGEEAQRAAGGVVVYQSGTRDQSAEHQGRRPDAADPSAYYEVLVAASDGRAGIEYRHERSDGTREWTRELYPREGQHLVVLPAQPAAILLERPDTRTAAARLRRRLPGPLLAEVARHADALVRLGEAGGLVRIRGALDDGTTVTLRLDPTTALLHAVDFEIDAPTFGDVALSWRFGDYRPSGAGRLPHTVEVTIAGRTFLDLTVDSVAVGPDAVSRLFALPAGVPEPSPIRIDPSDAAARARVVEVAPGVRIVRSLRSGFHPMFVEFEDFVVAIDPVAGYPLLHELPPGDIAPGPTAAWLSERYIELIRESVPGKPIRYVVLTHFHSDHSGGVRAFVAAGATALVAPETRASVVGLLRASHTVAPDRLAALRDAGSTIDGRVEVVEGVRTITDGTRVL